MVPLGDAVLDCEITPRFTTRINGERPGLSGNIHRYPQISTDIHGGIPTAPHAYRGDFRGWWFRLLYHLGRPVKQAPAR